MAGAAKHCPMHGANRGSDHCLDWDVTIMSPQMRSSAKPVAPWSRARDEPRLSDIINDPIVRLLMTKDKVSGNELLALIALARRHVGDSV